MNNSLRVGIAGLGTVGASLVRVLNEKSELLISQCGRPITVTGVSARDKTRDRGIDISNLHWFDKAEDLAVSDDVDVYVELIGGDEGPARASVLAALNAGKHVVTANKALLAKHGLELARAAEANGVVLNFEAAVAGGIPIVKTMRESISGNNTTRLYGIMNGTANYILTRMERDEISFEECLADAQRLGYAEADPTFDIEGNDTAHKLAILTSIAFGTEVAVDEIYLEGISNISLGDIQAARDLGYRIKLLGVAHKTDTGIEQRVHPTMVPLTSVIAQIDGVTNAVAVEADIVGSLLMSGPGAGGNATASAVMGDLADIAKSRPGHQQAPVFGRAVADLKPYQRAEIESHAGGYFVRMVVHDKSGAFAAIATDFAENDISLESIVQREPAHSKASDAKTVIIITHETTESAIRKAIKSITEEGYLVSTPQVIRIEKAE
ncbi:homoserine dehydrogenase [Ahrensia sp. 13_GOM-1096m]|uniref:homoserine dehydrogenase n=1 Tax=Ahrensia sp. 13_GOM-1096m TaxID=1380380 RepID=UPI00047DFAFD|nr:homoserine dehydrogenase [Ahrensia sp. 13_GOM-1096m]